MKKLIVSAGILTLLTVGCNDSKTDEKAASLVDTSLISNPDSAKPLPKTTVECRQRNMGKYKVFSIDQVAIMADLYRDLVFKSYRDATRQITLNPVILSELACNTKTLKLISAAEGTDITMIIEYVKDGDEATYYYDFEDIFGKGALCPPPNNCGITDTVRNPGDFTKEEIDSICSEYDMKKFHTLTAEEVAKMAEDYQEALKDDYRKVIQQIMMDPDLLYAILCGVEGFKLIAAAKDNGEITMVILYQRNGKTSYYDIKEVFGPNVLCPPPDNCGIPYNGLIKKNTKRPAQK